MKKSFVYLIIALMLATMLCGCGMDGDDGLIGASPRPTDAYDTTPTILPDVSSSTVPSVESTTEPSPEVKSPQVGEADGVKTSPKAGDTNTK